MCYLCRPKGSDCGIVNVNIPTSGAEIGGAFGMLLMVFFLSFKLLNPLASGLETWHYSSGFIFF